MTDPTDQTDPPSLVLAAPETADSQHRAVAALSGHIDTRTAATEVAAHLRDNLHGPCDLLVLFASFHHRAAMHIAVEHLRQTVAPKTLMATTAESVLGVEVELEGRAGLAALAMSLPGSNILPWSVTPQNPLDLSDEDAVRSRFGSSDSPAMIFADPFSTPAPQLLEALDRPTVGALASGASQAGHNRLFLDDLETSAGAIGVTLDGIDMQTVVSQGCSGIGEPAVVTKAKDNVILELGGQSPMGVLKSIALDLDDQRRQLINQGLLIGVVIDEYKDHFGRGDFLIRNVTHLDTKNGVIAIGDRVRTGQTVQFHVRDATTAAEDLQLLLDGQQLDERPLAALVFSCNGRGRRLFEQPNHDTTMIRKRLGDVPIAGLFAAGEIGPIGGKPYLHGHTLAMAVIRGS